MVLTPSSCGAVHRAIHVGQAGQRSRPVGVPSEAVEHFFRPGRANAINGSAARWPAASAIAAARIGRPVKDATDVDQARDGDRAIGAASETIQYLLCARQTYAVNGSTAVAVSGLYASGACRPAAKSRRAVKVATHVEQARLRPLPIRVAGETIQHFLCAGLVDFVNSSAAVTVTARGTAAAIGRAVQRAPHFDQTRGRVHSVGAARETIQHLLGAAR